MRNIRKALFVAGAISAATLLSSNVEAAGSINVQVGSQLIGFPDAQPFLDQSQRTQVPVRFVSEKLGYQVNWANEGSAIRVSIRNNDKEIVLRTGSNTATVNGRTVTFDTKAFLQQDRTYVPVRFVAENMGSNVTWDAKTGTAIIYSGATAPSAVAPVLASRSGFQAPSLNVTDIARKYEGVPYVWGGTTPSGFDCSGFVKYVFAQKGITLPRTSSEMYNMGTRVTQPQPGDLVFFTTYAAGASHVGIYLGNNEFISATSSRGVDTVSMSNPYWAPRYLGAKRL